jgi:hypothetical protein
MDELIWPAGSGKLCLEQLHQNRWTPDYFTEGIHLQPGLHL